MSTDRMRTYKIVFLMVLITAFAGCFFSANGSYCLEWGTIEQVCDGLHQEQLLSADGMENENIAGQNFSASADSFLRIEVVSRMGRNANRFYFNSLLAVLFKIAVIPSVIIILVVMLDERVIQALGRILRFVHDSDGKKEALILQSSIQ